MARTGVTEFDLLISCPGDVEEYVDDIEDAVRKFNRLFGELHHIRVNERFWRNDTYSQMGGKPQEIINEQLVSKCDMAVAVFWTRFGTPTDSYGSGTEEEIEEMIASDKPVFLYFLDKACPVSKISSDLERVREFKERCKQRGIFKEVSDERDLSEKFHMDLTMYFQEKLKRDGAVSSTDVPERSGTRPARQIENSKNASAHNRLTKDKERDIIRKIHSLQKHVLPGRRSGGYERPGTVSDAVIFQYQKKLVMDFAAENGIYIAPEFWNLGNLRRIVIGGGTVDCEGTEEEIERYDEIMSLCREIEEFNRRGNYL